MWFKANNAPHPGKANTLHRRQQPLPLPQTLAQAPQRWPGGAPATTAIATHIHIITYTHCAAAVCRELPFKEASTVSRPAVTIRCRTDISSTEGMRCTCQHSRALAHKTAAGACIPNLLRDEHRRSTQRRLLVSYYGSGRETLSAAGPRLYTEVPPRHASTRPHTTQLNAQTA